MRNGSWEAVYQIVTGVLKNLETLFQRGVAYLTLVHFYPNLVVNPCYPCPEDIVKLASRTRI